MRIFLLRTLRTLTLLGLAIGLCSCASGKGWVLSRSSMFDRKTFQAREQWVVAGPKYLGLGYRKINRMSPVIYKSAKGDLIIEGNAVDGIAAYTKENGFLAWRIDIANGVEGSAALINDRLFFGGCDGQFYSVDASNGKVLWTFPTRIENLAEPVLDDGIVYFLSGNGSLFALEADTGKQLWLYSRQDPSSLNVRGGSKPAIQNGLLYVGFSDGALVALNAKTGQVKWEHQLNNNKKFRDLDTDPLVDHEFIYAVGFDDRLYSLRSATGDLVWKSDAGGYGGMLIQGEKLFYATTSGEFVAVDRSTGTRIWAYKLEDGIATTPSIYRGLIVMGESQGALVFLDSGSGKVVGRYDPGRGILSPPKVDEKDNRVYFISGEANIYSINVGFKYPQAFSFLR